MHIICLHKNIFLHLFIIYLITNSCLLRGQNDIINPALLPQLEPSHIRKLEEDNSTDIIHYKNVFEGEDGRLWFDPYYNYNIVSSINLVQYDGYSFTPVNLGHHFEIATTSTVLCGFTHEGKIFGYTSNTLKNNIFLIDPQAYHVELYNLESLEIQDIAIRNVIQTRDRKLLILASSPENLYLISIHDGKFELALTMEAEQEPLTAAMSMVPQLPLVETSNGIWFMSESLPIFRYNLQTKQIKKYGSDQFPMIQLSPDAQSIPPKFIHKQNQLFFYFPNTTPQIFNLNLTQDTIRSFNYFPPTWKIINTFKDQKENLLFLFDTPDKSLQALLQSKDNKWYNFSKFVQNKNKSQEILIGGKDFFRHVFLLSEHGITSMGIKESNGIRSFPIPSTIGIAGSFLENTFLVFSDGNKPFLVDAQNGVREGSLENAPFLSCFSPEENKSGRVSRAVIEGQSGWYWTHYSDKIIEFNPIEGLCHSYSMSAPITRMSEVNDSTLAVMIVGVKIALFNTSTKQTHYLPKFEEKLPGYYFNPKAGPDSILWVPTSGGLWKINLQTQENKVIGRGPEFDDFRFQYLYRDQEGKLWLGAMIGGLHIYDPSTDQVKIINHKQGLVNNSVRCLVQDKDGIVWAATNKGISLIDNSGTVLYTLTSEDGLPDGNFRRFGASSSKDGRLLFCMDSTVVLIDPPLFKKRIFDEKKPEKVFIRELSHYDKKEGQEVTKSGVINIHETIFIPASKRYLKLRVALPDYMNPSENHFAYKIKEKDQDWTYIGSQNEVFLNHLPAGRYQILIKGANSQNIWTSEAIALNIRAEEFFYKKSWFYLLLASVAGILVFTWIRRLRLEKIRLEKEVSRRTQQIIADKELIAQQAEELRQMDELKSRFFTNISHELRTPLTLVTTPVERIIKKKSHLIGQDIQKSLRNVLQNGRKLLLLVEELLDLSKLEANKLQLKEEPTPLFLFCRRLFSAFESRAAIRKIKYHFQTDISPEEYYLIDRKRLEKIINNLLSNALKFTPSEGQVIFSIDKKEGNLIFSIKDTGRGIPSEDLPQIFDRYFQTSRSDIPKEGGTGIGLALSKELTRLMQGTLSVQSEWKKGSTFILSLPARLSKSGMTNTGREKLTSGIVGQDALTSSESHGKLSGKILVVEDNPDMQQLIVSLLSDFYQCQVAHNGAEAWQKIQSGAIKSSDIDLILSDIMMPEMDGYELLEHIKQTTDWQQKPMIMLTARADEEDKLQALRLGVDDYLLKPFSPDELLVRTANLIKNYRKKQSFRQEATFEAVQIDFDDTPSADQQWLQELEATAKTALEKQIDITAGYLAGQLALSDRQLLRRIKALTGLSSKQYIQEIKLQKARHLLENRIFNTIAEVSYACGFNTPGYFTKVYEKHYGKRPAEYFAELP